MTIPDPVRARDLVGYGRTPPTWEWPGGAQVVVNLVLVYEEGSEYSVMWGDDRNDGWGEYADPGVQPPQRDPGTESHYEYGSRAGVWRLARIYDSFDVPVTVSAAAVALELNPAVAEWMRDHDHDLLGHGWRWTEAWTFDRDEEGASIRQAINTYERVLGARPDGWNSRGWPSENTRGLLREIGGFLYHSEGSADDVPYYEVVDSEPMLVIPYSKTYNDSRFLMNPGFASPQDFLDTMVMGLDELLREGETRRTMMTVAVHARWSGQAAPRRRASHVPRACDHAAGRGVHAPPRHRPLVARHVSAGVRCVVYHGTGGREVIAVEERPEPVPGRFEVVIAPPFAGVNPADVLQREGRHPAPPGWPADVGGLEVAGPVVAVGDGVASLAVGDRAFGLVGGGGMAERVLAVERELVRIPDGLDAQTAAAVPQAYLTAFDAIVMQAGLAAGDVLLVNGASGGVGTAAVQIGAAMGARVVANVRTEGLRPRVAELGATAQGADEAFAHVRELGGADVILELVGAVHMAGNMEALGRGGRLMIVGGKPGDEAAVVLRDLMSKRAQIRGSTLRTRPGEEKAALVQEFGRRVVPLLASGVATALVDRVFPLADAADAFDYVREPGKLGKVLLELPG